MATNNDHIALPNPPRDCLYPLHVLNRYLASLGKEQMAFSSTKRQDELLQTVDFLYGSALDGALAVLESSPGSDGSSGANTCHNVTCLQSPRRALYTVSSSSSAKSTAAAMRGGRTGLSSSWSQPQDSCYLCMIPENDNSSSNNGSDSTQQDEEDSAEIYYCSCRSFLEKSRNGGSSSGGAVSLCKHLLALKLMPVLGLTCTTVQLASEDEFSHALLQRVSP